VNSILKWNSNVFKIDKLKSFIYQSYDWYQLKSPHNQITVLCCPREMIWDLAPMLRLSHFKRRLSDSFNKLPMFAYKCQT
jgi:hypothetical protein